MISNEIFNYIQKSTNRNQGYVEIKLNKKKPYDRLEWNFIEKNFITIGLPIKITKIIMKFINNVSFYILVNGYPTKTIIPTKGIRQRYHISLYISTLCAYIFSNIIANAQRKESSLMLGEKKSSHV